MKTITERKKILKIIKNEIKQEFDDKIKIKIKNKVRNINLKRDELERLRYDYNEEKKSINEELNKLEKNLSDVVSGKIKLEKTIGLDKIEEIKVDDSSDYE